MTDESWQLTDTSGALSCLEILKLKGGLNSADQKVGNAVAVVYDMEQTCCNMPLNELCVQECDATADAMKSEAGYQKRVITKPKRQVKKQSLSNWIIYV